MSVRSSIGSPTFSDRMRSQGVAPAYRPFRIAFRLQNPDEPRPTDLNTADAGNLNWLPSKMTEQAYAVVFPGGLAAGGRTLKIKLLLENGQTVEPVAIGLKAVTTDADGFGAVAHVEVE